MPRKLSFKNQCKLFLAQWLVRLGKLTHDDFTKHELQALIDDRFPYSFSFDIPIGTGSVRVLEGNTLLDSARNRIGLQCLASLDIEVAASTIYRAHVVLAFSATPHYNASTSILSLTEMRTDAITLVNDDYALIKDTQFLLAKLFPQRLNTLISNSLKSAVSLFTAGTSDKASEYLSLYLTGSKQAILDYHIPQIDAEIKRQINQNDLQHIMRDNQWREVLFSRYGKSVRVEDDVLRFYLC